MLISQFGLLLFWDLTVWDLPWERICRDLDLAELAPNKPLMTLNPLMNLNLELMQTFNDIKTFHDIKPFEWSLSPELPPAQGFSGILGHFYFHISKRGSSL